MVKQERFMYIEARGRRTRLELVKVSIRNRIWISVRFRVRVCYVLYSGILVTV